ncbi:MAG: alpha/beta fold hydrolase [Flavisolibacter sp.]
MTSSTQNIYCISGLGADEKAFERLEVKGCTLQHINWMPPAANESISSYATRMLAYVKEENPIILGLSFGGMIAIEMAKQVPIKKLILVSTVKRYMEIPRWMRIAGTLNLHKLIPIRSNRLTEKADDRRMGIKTPEEKKFVDFYRKNADQKYVDWAVDQILNWKNTWVPPNTYQIHGEEDRMFPIRNIREPDYVIRNGSHIMVLNKAAEVSACIEEIVLK